MLLATTQGDPAAQFELGGLYEKGASVPQDIDEAMRWYTKAAEQGLPAAQFKLGLIHMKGRGVTKDEKLAARWFRKSAENGHILAQLELGLMYGDGRGVQQNYVYAYMWLNFAWLKRRHDAKSRLDAYSKKMTEEQIAEAEALVKKWQGRFVRSQ